MQLTKREFEQALADIRYHAVAVLFLLGVGAVFILNAITN